LVFIINQWFATGPLYFPGVEGTRLTQEKGLNYLSIGNTGVFTKWPLLRKGVVSHNSEIFGGKKKGSCGKGGLKRGATKRGI